MAEYNKEESLVKAVIYYKDKGRRTFYSRLRHDKRGKQYSINKLLLLIFTASPYISAMIYDNQNTVIDENSGEIKDVELHKFIANKQIY